MNSGVPIPTLVVYVAPPPSTLRARLDSRGTVSRLEKLGGPERELAYYRDAFIVLKGRGWNQFWLDDVENDPTLTAELVLERFAAT